MMLNDYQLSILQGFSTSIWLGSCSPNGSIDIVRLSGARAAEDNVHLALFVPEKYAQTFLENASMNPQISLMFSSMETFEAFQVKGTYQSHRACTPEEVSYQKAYVEGCSQYAVSIGLKAAKAFTSYYTEPGIAMYMKMEEIYEQTPKAGTGTKIS